jgi:hypothetical protein
MLVLTPPLKVVEVFVALACVNKGAILVEGVVLVACVSGRVGVATCAQRIVPLPATRRVADMKWFQMYCVMY